MPTLDIRVANNSDDAEQESTGTMSINGNKIDFGVQLWEAFRFENVTIPANSTITTAYVTVEAYGSYSTGSLDLVIQMEDADNPGTFTAGNYNISGRFRTGSHVDWSVPEFTNGLTYNTPDIKSPVQAVVNRAGWASGNAMVVILSGLGSRRAAYSHDEDSSRAALLHIEYTTATTLSAAIQARSLSRAHVVVESSANRIVELQARGLSRAEIAAALYEENFATIQARGLSRAEIESTLITDLATSVEGRSLTRAEIAASTRHIKPTWDDEGAGMGVAPIERGDPNEFI